jgi:hypothetical protein
MRGATCALYPSKRALGDAPSGLLRPDQFSRIWVEVVSWEDVKLSLKARNCRTSPDPATPGYRDEGFGRGGTREQEQL